MNHGCRSYVTIAQLFYLKLSYWSGLRPCTCDSVTDDLWEPSHRRRVLFMYLAIIGGGASCGVRFPGE